MKYDADFFIDHQVKYRDCIAKTSCCAAAAATAAAAAAAACSPAHEVKRDIIVDGKHAVVDVLLVWTWQHETSTETFLQTRLVARQYRPKTHCNHRRHNVKHSFSWCGLDAGDHAR